MDDYIKRENAVVYAISLIDRIYDGTIAPREIIKEAKQQVINEMNSTDRLPAAEVRENVRGKWVENRAGDCVCQHCGYEALCFYGGKQCKSDFCPHCGADMRKEIENG